jgi:hypothetical protein
MDNNREWEVIKKSMNTSAKQSLGYYELKFNKTYSISYWMRIASMMLGRQIHTTKTLMPDPNTLEVQISFAKLKYYNSSDSD